MVSIYFIFLPMQITSFVGAQVIKSHEKYNYNTKIQQVIMILGNDYEIKSINYNILSHDYKIKKQT